VIAAHELEPVAGRLRDELGLGEPFSDPGVQYFGLNNAVFALLDTFLEVVSPVTVDTAAGRWLERRGGDCGYMVMFQVGDLDSARERVNELGIREVFEVSLDDISEVHLHPADMRGAIVALSAPKPPDVWRWGGPDWQARSAPLQIAGAEIAVRDPAAVQQRWETVLGAELAAAGIHFTAADADQGLTAITIAGAQARGTLELGGVRFVFT